MRTILTEIELQQTVCSLTQKAWSAVLFFWAVIWALSVQPLESKSVPMSCKTTQRPEFHMLIIPCYGVRFDLSMCNISDAHFTPTWDQKRPLVCFFGALYEYPTPRGTTKAKRLSGRHSTIKLTGLLFTFYLLCCHPWIFLLPLQMLIRLGCDFKISMCECILCFRRSTASSFQSRAGEYKTSKQSSFYRKSSYSRGEYSSSDDEHYRPSRW